MAGRKGQICTNTTTGRRRMMMTTDERRLEDDVSVYPSLRPVFIVSTAFGMTPLVNVRTSSSRHLRFRWFHLKMLYTMVVAFGLCFGTYMMASSYTYILQDEQDINEVAFGLTAPIFFVANSASLMQCVAASRQLPALLHHWDSATINLVHYVKPGVERSAIHVGRWTIGVVAGLLAASAVAENALHDINLPIHFCPGKNVSFFECHLTRGNPHFNQVFGHGIPVAAIFFVIQKFANVVWNFHDILIVVLALAIRANFKVLADYVRRHCGDTFSVDEWRRLREDHLAVIDLTQHLDRVLSLVILQSYAVNLFFICMQVSLAIRPLDSTPSQSTYFCFSLMHLVARTCTVSASICSIHEQAVAPLEYLFDCPKKSYCIEIHRFTSHLMNIPIGLTAFQFFLVDRSIFLALLSVIITYELILLKMA